MAKLNVALSQPHHWFVLVFSHSPRPVASPLRGSLSRPLRSGGHQAAVVIPNENDDCPEGEPDRSGGVANRCAPEMASASQMYQRCNGYVQRHSMGAKAMKHAYLKEVAELQRRESLENGRILKGGEAAKAASEAARRPREWPWELEPIFGSCNNR